MALYQVQVALQGKSGLPEDQFVNSWYFEDQPATLEMDQILAGDLCARVFNFYDSIVGSAALRDWLSPVIRQNDHVVKCYRLDDPKPRVPLAMITPDFAVAPAGTGMPEEVSVCLSFRAEVESGVNMARRRGRVYLGPLDTSVMAVGGFSEPRPSTPFIDHVLNRAVWLQNEVQAIGRTWVVHSPTTLPLARYPVVHAWVDNGFDTQRRRGKSPSGRSVATIA